ncbi:hypothetical protein DFO62_103363 [Serratia fonticola]|nr:hypothetical protein DFO62_103363 [Serratia fonticola]
MLNTMGIIFLFFKKHVEDVLNAIVTNNKKIRRVTF